MSKAVTLTFLGDTRNLDGAFRSVQGGAAKTESRLGKFASNLKPMMAAAGVSIALAFGKASVDAFGESQRAAAQTAAVLKSTGNSAGTSVAGVQKLSAELMKLSGVEDEAVQAGANMLLTFTNVKNGVGKGNQVFDDATKTLLDMSVAMGTEPKNAAIQLGKALNDPIKGITALTRVGVTFTQAQKDQIKALVEAGDTMGAQKVILAELNKEFGGSAKAAGDTLTPTQKLSLAMGELQEKVGGVLIPALSKLADVGLGIIAFFEAMPGPVKVALAVLGGLVVTVLAISKAIQVWTAVQAALNAVLLMNPIGLVIIAVAALVAGIVIAYKNSETFRDIIKGAFDIVGKAAGLMADLAIGYFKLLVNMWLGAAEWIVKGAASAFGWVPGIGPKLKQAAKAIEGFRDDANAALDGIRDKNVRVNISMTGARELASAMGNGATKAPGLGRRAAGGPVTDGTPYIVGERGPELFIPGSSGGIVPNHKMGGSTTVVINMPPGSNGDDVVRAITEYERRNGTAWRN